jgi:hypothetical protein
MSFIVENTGGDFERCPPGMHLARCYRIIDLGTQKKEYKGQVKFMRQVMIGWEILGTDDNGQPLRMKDGRPFAIFRNYTLAWNDKANLRIHLQSWRGKPFSQEELRRFDLKNVLGAFCMLNVIEREGQNGTVHSNISGVTPVPGMIKQAGLPPPVNANQIFTIANPDMEVFNSLSDNLKNKITGSPEWQKRSAPAKEKADFDDSMDDSIPF